jgi:hypothetical protein
MKCLAPLRPQALTREKLLGFSPEGGTSLPVCISHRTPSVPNSPQSRKVRQVQEGRDSEKRVRFNPVLGLAWRPWRLCGEFGIFKA